MPKPKRVKAVKMWMVINRKSFKQGIFIDYSWQLFSTKKDAIKWQREWYMGGGIKYGIAVRVTITPLTKERKV